MRPWAMSSRLTTLRADLDAANARCREAELAADRERTAKHAAVEEEKAAGAAAVQEEKVAIAHNFAEAQSERDKAVR